MLPEEAEDVVQNLHNWLSTGKTLVETACFNDLGRSGIVLKASFCCEKIVSNA